MRLSPVQESQPAGQPNPTPEGAEAVVKLNGVLVSLAAAGEVETGGMAFAAPGTRVSVRSLGDDADWRENAQLVFELDQGLTVGYGGLHECQG